MVVTEDVRADKPIELKKNHDVTVTTRLYNCCVHSCELHLPKTKSVVSGTASFISAASSLAAQSVSSLSCKKAGKQLSL